jgi:hypothetical protein
MKWTVLTQDVAGSAIWCINVWVRCIVWTLVLGYMSRLMSRNMSHTAVSHVPEQALRVVFISSQSPSHFLPIPISRALTSLMLARQSGLLLTNRRDGWTGMTLALNPTLHEYNKVSERRFQEVRETLKPSVRADGGERQHT